MGTLKNPDAEALWDWRTTEDDALATLQRLFVPEGVPVIERQVTHPTQGPSAATYAVTLCRWLSDGTHCHVQVLSYPMVRSALQLSLSLNGTGANDMLTRLLVELGMSQRCRIVMVHRAEAPPPFAPE